MLLTSHVCSIQEAQPKTAEEEVKVRMLEGWVLLATRSKVDAEQALSRFMEIATSSVSIEGVLMREVSLFSRGFPF